jgi:hypothetical protein
VLIGGRAVLLRGASGAGKSILALELLAEAQRRGIDAALIADDRVALAPHHGRLLVHAAAPIAGQAELRSLGIVEVAYEPTGVVALVVDLVWEQPPRMPDAVDETVLVDGVLLPRVALWSQDRAPVLKVWHALMRLPSVHTSGAGKVEPPHIRT